MTKIGVFDSGVGGLTLLEEALRQRPQADYLFYADVDHVPYGLRTHEEILQYTDESVQFLIDRGCECIVVACNTATAVAVETLRRRYALPIVGIEPAVKSALAHHALRRVLVVATPVTLREEKLHRLLSRCPDHDMVDLHPLPQLVAMAEREDYDALPYLRRELAPYPPERYSEVVLGCTHFNYFRDSFLRLFPQAEVIDGAEGTIRRMCSLLPAGEDGAPGRVAYFFSGRPVTSPDELARLERRLARLRQMRAL